MSKTRATGFGFAYVARDLQGYRTGSMNEVLTKNGALLRQLQRGIMV